MTERSESLTNRLSGVCETLLIPLAARVVESESARPALQDPRGVAFARQLDFDPQHVARDKWNKVGCLARTIILDAAVNDFLDRSPRAAVINLGAGLCTRYWRVHPKQSLQWFDVDLPAVIQLKRELLADFETEPSDANRSYTAIEADVTDPGLWDQIPRDAAERVLVIAEGLLMYLDQSAVRHLITRLADEYAGGELLLEAWSPFVRRVWGTLSPALRRTGATLRWGLSRPQVIEHWDARLRLKNEWRPGDWEPHRWGLLRFAPRLRRSLTKVIHFQLGDSDSSAKSHEFAA